MNFDDYQRKAAKYDLSNETEDLNDPGFIEKVLGLTGEAGETADKIKKIIRDKNGKPTHGDLDGIKKELGDVLWYIANISRYLNFTLSDVASTNINKLERRRRHNTLHGTGDNR